jgi:hypothetical protein
MSRRKKENLRAGDTLRWLLEAPAAGRAKLARRLRKIRAIIAREWGADNPLLPQIDAALQAGTRSELEKVLELVWLTELSRSDLGDISRL